MFNLPVVTSELLQRIKVGESLACVERATIKNAGASVSSYACRLKRKFSTRTILVVDPRTTEAEKALVVTRIS